MKKRAILSGIIALAVVFCGCSKNEHASLKVQTNVTEKPAATTAATTKAVTTKATTKVIKAVTTTTEAVIEPTINIDADNTATVTQNSDGSFNVYFSYGCSMTFPSDWAGHVEIKDNTVYSILMQDEEKSYDGKLFSVECHEQTPTLHGNERMLLGVSGQGYLIATVPQDLRFDMNNEKMNQEYDLLSADYETVWSTAICDNSSADFQPVSLQGFTNPEYVSDSLYFGTWEATTDQWTEESVMDIGCIQSSPYLVFCNDGTLAYQCFNNCSTGSYLLSRDSNAEITALGFINGQIQEISMYHLTLTVSGMPKLDYYSADGELHSTTHWGFYKFSDSQVYGNDPWL